MIPQQFIEELNRDADIVGLIGRYVDLKKKGSSYMGLCPFHSEKSPSFSVNPQKNFYHCFGCGASGTAINFLMKHVHGSDFIAAVKDLANQLGREVPSSGRAVPAHQKQAYALLEEMQEKYVAELFKQATGARKYLFERGVSKKIAVEFGLGFAPQRGGLSKDAQDKVLIAAGLAKRADDGNLYPYFRKRIMFPIHNTQEKVIGFAGRIFGEGEPKYLNSPQSATFNKSYVVYNLHRATKAFKDTDYCLVVEGYMDVIMLAKHGFTNAVATMGTAATPEQLRAILTRTNRCVFCFDGDEAGRRAAHKALANCMPVLEDGKEVAFVFLAEGEDPDSYVQSKGADKFTELVTKAKPLAEMLVNPPEIANKKLTTSERVLLWHDAALLLEKLPDKAAFLKAELYRELATASGIDVDELKQAAAKAKPVERQYAEPTARSNNRRTMNDSPIFRILVCLAARPEYAQKLANVPLFVERNRTSSKADLDLCIRVIEAVNRQFDQGGKGDVLGYLTELGLSGLVRQLEQKSSTLKNPETTLQDFISKMNRQAEKNQETQRVKEALTSA